MSEPPAILARDAKGIHQSLKESLKSKEPFDREVDFQRKKLRRHYLNLLLLHPHAKESKDVENHLWMQTSYAFIASYKQRILNLDRVIQSKMRQQQQPNQQRTNNTPVVEHRKMIQRFRQFLAEEDKFWIQLVGHLWRSFALEEATQTLVTLGFISQTDSLASNPSESSDGSPETTNGRNHFQFPLLDPSTPFKPTSPEEKASWLAILSKALVCLGDIARYRELYNESGGRPRAGQEDGPPRNRRSRRGTQSEEPLPRPRNYEKAQQCYEQARLLVPDDGNPSHQLAIIATYRKDSFVSLTHYYRALCVRVPYDTASENLLSVLGKALEAWKTRSRRERSSHETLPPRVQVETFKENIVVLHSLWKVAMEKGLKKMESLSRVHQKVVYDTFYSLVSNRYLPSDMITSSVILSQGALWKHRMIRPMQSSTSNRRPELPPPPEGTSTVVEWYMLDHLFSLHRALLDVGLEELKVPPPKDVPVDDLAQRITATLRRCLPALRIAGKWLRANFRYLTQDHEFEALQEIKHAEGVEITRNSNFMFSRTSKHTQLFWETYARFIFHLSRTFDPYRLPALSAPLEEDTDMKGFLPLKGLMGGPIPEIQGPGVSGPRQAQESHPNEWQLMRIADLIQDAKELTRFENCPIKLSGLAYIFRDELVEPQLSPAHPEEPLKRDSRFDVGKNEADDDNMTEITSRTDDDMLQEVFNINFLNTSAEEIDFEEEKIVWDPRAPSTPIMPPSLPSPPSHVTPLLNSKPLKSPVKLSPTHSRNLSSFSSPTSPAIAPPQPTTAQDLLNEVMSGRSTLTHLESPVAKPPLLFGSELSHSQGHSIWSASQDEKTKFNSQLNQTYQAVKQQQHISATSSSFSGVPQQSIWSSSYPVSTQNSQQTQMTGATMPPGPYPHAASFVQGTHQRVTSVSSTVPHSPLAQRLGAQDPFVYPLSSTQQHQQQPIHRPEGLSLSMSGYMGTAVGGSPGLLYQSTPAAVAATDYYSSHPTSLSDPRFTHRYLDQTASSSHLWGNIG